MHKKIVGILFLLACMSLYAEADRENFEFLNQNISDIVYILSAQNPVPIITDDTVTGTGTFLLSKAATGTFSDIFDAFLESNRLYVHKTETLWIVSKILITERDSGGIGVDAYDVTPAQLIDKIADKTKQTVTYDMLPVQRFSIHIPDISVLDAIKLVLKPYAEYTVEQGANGIHIKRQQNAVTSAAAFGKKECIIRKNGIVYDVSLENAAISDVFRDLFTIAEKEYSNFIQTGLKIEKLQFSGKTFEDSLQLILEQINGKYVLSETVWYLLPGQQNDTLKNIRLKNKQWYTFALKYRPIAQLKPLVLTRFPDIELQETGTYTFAAFAVPEERIALESYLAQLDRRVRSEPIVLKYIKTEDLYKSLPPTVSREDLTDAGNGDTIFFTGPQEKQEAFLKELAVLDKPKKSIRYDLLILQYQKSSNLSWGITSSMSPLSPGNKTLVTGELGNLLNLSFDAITVFGYLFAARINAALSKNEANVFTDTTLYGVSGQKITFKNTNTFRYRDSNIDPQTGKPLYTGITREIISGLVLEIDGWISGDGMVTMDVTASVSKRGVDVSTKTGNPPPTSEKIVTTQVKARSGEPVVLSGLTQNDKTFVEQGVPFLSRIPVLGNLFKSRDETEEKNEMVIYLVPHIEEIQTDFRGTDTRKRAAYEALVLNTDTAVPYDE